jgi:ligand-binding sensor domain-containing protein
VYCTNQNGLFIYDLKSGGRTIIEADEAIAKVDVNSISIDQNQGVWLGTTDGLSNINMLTNEITAFDVNPGTRGRL